MIHGQQNVKLNHITNLKLMVAMIMKTTFHTLFTVSVVGWGGAVQVYTEKVVENRQQPLVCVM
jgi:hypothetical protein